jgi:hypothetical protein
MSSKIGLKVKSPLLTGNTGALARISFRNSILECALATFAGAGAGVPSYKWPVATTRLLTSSISV